MDYQDYKVKKPGTTTHFWHRAKLGLIQVVLKNLYPDKTLSREIIDVGCGTGEELQVLNDYGALTAIDKNQKALKLARNHQVDIIHADIETYDLIERPADLICAFDILEHLDNDQAVLNNIQAGLKPNGVFFFTVPAHTWLYGPHDIALNHKRRYNKAELKAKLKTAGFKQIELYYWNTVLFPLEAIYRLLKKFLYSRVTTTRHSESSLSSAILNNLLYQIFKIDNWLARKKFSSPWGLTIYGLAKK